jgi:hypothetical protein
MICLIRPKLKEHEDIRFVALHWEGDFVEMERFTYRHLGYGHGVDKRASLVGEDFPIDYLPGWCRDRAQDGDVYIRSVCSYGIQFLVNKDDWLISDPPCLGWPFVKNPVQRVAWTFEQYGDGEFHQYFEILHRF